MVEQFRQDIRRKFRVRSIRQQKYCPKEVIKATSLKTFKAGLLNALERIIILNQSPFTE